MALEKGREKFQSKFRGHWNRWIDESSGGKWKEKQWRKDVMADPEGLFPVIEVSEKESPRIKEKQD